MIYQNEYNSNMNSMNHSGKFYYLKKITQILLSLSVFSYLLLISHSSLVPVFVQSYDYLIKNYSIKLFTYTSERNYIFLLCNGILVLIIRTSGLISKITPLKSSSKGVKIDDHLVEEVHEVNRTNIVTKVEAFEEKGKDINGGDYMGKGGIDNQRCEIEEWEKQEEEEEFEDVIDEVLSADELNKKFDDFIKKVKQEILGAENNLAYEDQQVI